ncbi:MAG: hypothetical protein HKP14_06170 [Bacteroidia bacterium]|nr:hypothetical protein [Bacteroidia bacterium]
MLNKTISFALVAMFMCTNLYSQYENSFFDNDKYEDTIDSSHILLHFDNLSYFRNCEYLSPVDKGSTYIGFNLLPYAQYSFNDKAQIYGGLLIRYDFGNPELKLLEPYFKFTYNDVLKHNIVFGNLNGTLQHRMIEPLYDYERAVTDRFEQGLQISKPGDVIEYDAWIDWHDMIYENDPKNERFVAGYNLYLNPVNTERNKLSLNAQGITVHSAGEIDLNSAPNSVEYNFAYGLEYTHFFNEETNLFLAGHAAFYEDRSNTLVNGLIDGVGQLGVIRLTHKEYQFVLNYWDSHQYQGPWGEQLYHSLGNKNWPSPQDYRKMIGARVGYEVTIGKNLVFLNRLGFNYNVHPNKLDVTMENYLRWHFTGNKKKVNLN